jgi:negative regulator of flagellin synthesis FlgM
MKISGDKPYIIEAYVKKAGEEKAVQKGKKSEKPSSRPDKVEISVKAREKRLREIRELLEKVPDVREEKVAALKTAIEDGTYEVKGKKVAEKMIKEGIDEYV